MSRFKRIERKHPIAKLEFLAALTGILIAIQARANGQLAHLIRNPTEAALISFTTGLTIMLAILTFNKKIRAGFRGIRASVKTKKLAKWPLFAGVLGGTAIGIQAQVVPLIGVAIYSVASISGQTAISLLVDRIGLTGGGKIHISVRRILAAALTIIAVLVSVIDKLSLKNFAILAVLVTIIAGALVGFQRALNGLINEHSRQSISTSLLNFITGVTVLLLVMILLVVFHHDQIHALPSGPWWIYLGGVTGGIYVAFAATVVQHLGVLTFTLFSVGGQLLGSILIDFISPSNNAHVTWYLVIGILLTYAGVLAGGQSRLFRKYLKKAESNEPKMKNAAKPYEISLTQGNEAE